MSKSSALSVSALLIVMPEINGELFLNANFLSYYTTFGSAT